MINSQLFLIHDNSLHESKISNPVRNPSCLEINFAAYYHTIDRIKISLLLLCNCNIMQYLAFSTSKFKNPCRNAFTKKINPLLVSFLPSSQCFLSAPCFLFHHFPPVRSRRYWNTLTLHISFFCIDKKCFCWTGEGGNFV